MNAAKATFLWLASICTCLFPACALASVAPDNRFSEVSDADTTATLGWQTYTVQGSLAGAGANGSAAAAADTFHVYVPPLSESLGYDASGNRASDSHWAESWNALDQLTTIIESNPYSTATATRLDCVYDVSGRRVQKQVTVGGQVTKRTTTLWDGWLPMMEIDYGASGLESARRYYTWGPDASGSLDGAAGIGGLVEIYEIKPTAATRSLPIYDGIGNVVGLVDETTGQSVATYQYGPFGEVVGVYGPRAESCPLRFQTKLYDEETGFYYFGGRYYDPKTQTWLSRDPERESGGINLYAYCGNDPVGNYDPIGLAAPPATPGSNPQQNAHDALLFFAKFIHGMAFPVGSILGLFESPSDPLAYAGNVETFVNGVTLDMPQIAAAYDDPQKSAEIVQGIESQFTTPEGLGNLTFGLALGFAGPKFGDFLDAPVTAQPSGLDMISAAKAQVEPFASPLAFGEGGMGAGHSRTWGAMEGLPAGYVGGPGAMWMGEDIATDTYAADSTVGSVLGKLNLYPQVIDPRTGGYIPLPSNVGEVVPLAERVPWGAAERGDFISQWYQRGYSTPSGGWENYDIHHILPREYGGGNDFWNLVPVERQTHQGLFNSFWQNFRGL